jgi:hypothetical protein
MSPGDAASRKRKAAVLCVVWSLLLVQGFALPSLGQDAEDDAATSSSRKSRVVIRSSPSGRPITLNDQRRDEATPAYLELYPGQYSIVVNAEGYQPLSHNLTVAIGGEVELEFILLETPPEPPTQEELRALMPPLGTGDPNADYWAEAQPRHLANDACKDCHGSILELHAQGEHRTLACEDCHSDLTEHVKEGEVTNAIQVIRGDGIQGLCMICHDRNNRNRIREPARTVEIEKHLRKLNVRKVNRCEDCHHVHDPQKWVHEAREMVGLPEMMASIPLLEEKLAKEKQAPYSTMSEIFLVFPLAPGVLGLAVSEGEGQFPAEVLIVTGLVLSVGSYLLGQYVLSRELDNIRALNDERRAANIRVKDHNILIKKAMADHERAINIWIEESEGRGRVIVRGEE